jgi:hypothetical protein
MVGLIRIAFTESIVLISSLRSHRLSDERLSYLDVAEVQTDSTNAAAAARTQTPTKRYTEDEVDVRGWPWE